MLPITSLRPIPTTPFRSQPRLSPTQKNSGRPLVSLSFYTFFGSLISFCTPSPPNISLWAPRASFEIRRLRRLSRGSADPREYSRSWRLVQSCPAHVARPGSQESAASLFSRSLYSRKFPAFLYLFIIPKYITNSSADANTQATGLARQIPR